MNTAITASQSAPTLPAVPTSTPAPNAPLVEGSIVAASVLYFLKEGFSFFKSKDATEEKLMLQLIADLRLERASHLKQQTEILEQLQESNKRSAIALNKIGEAIRDINSAVQLSKRTETEIFHSLRQTQELVKALHEKIDRSELQVPKISKIPAIGG